MEFIYKTEGTCSKQIILQIDENTDTIIDVHFIGGCVGNTLGISSLVRNMHIDDVIHKLEGIQCGLKPTSCPDQLSQALKTYKITHTNL